MWYVAIFQDGDGSLGFREFHVDGDGSDLLYAMGEWIAIRPVGSILRVLAEREWFDWQIVGPKLCKMEVFVR